MAAKTGGTRRAPAATSTVVAGADVSPADVQETLIPADTDLMEVEGTVDLLKALVTGSETVTEAETPDTPAEIPAEVPEVAESPAVNRLAALAALTGAVPDPDTPALAPAVEAVANGRESVWADDDKELVTAIIAVTSYQGIINGARQCAYKGETLHATEAVIARGVALGALVRV